MLNNGVCDEEIITDYECLFDYPDCTEDLRREVECNFAVQQSYIGCEIAIEMFLNYPYCEGIHLCCPDLRSDFSFYYKVLNLDFLINVGYGIVILGKYFH